MNAPLIADAGVTRHIMKAFHLRASRRLGQNFLISPSVVDEIVDAAKVRTGDRVLEIGPGIGTLTQGLAEAGADVTAVELDRKLLAVLSKTLHDYENVHVVYGDILKVDICDLMGEAPFKVVANLPYYITTPIIMTLLEKRLPISKIVTMVQREVALRMTATPGGKDYGSLSVAVQYYTRSSIVTDVPPRSFLPPPEVMSSVIVSDVLPSPPVDVKDEVLFFRVVRAAFGKRRKTLANSLTGLSLPRHVILAALERAGIDASRRAETLTLDEFSRVGDAIHTLTGALRPVPPQATLE